jgi:Lrp/AsnC family transcriptional regulator for asnA, asnC and gidA
MRGLDETDRRILAALEADASRTITDLSREFRMPRATVQYRIAKMRRTGIIKAIQATVDHAKLGRPIQVFVLLRFLSSPEVSEHRLAKQVGSLPWVERVHLVTGEWDMLVEMHVASMEELTHVLVDRIRKFRGVSHTMTLVSLPAVKPGSA